MKNVKLHQLYLEYRTWPKWYYHLTFNSLETGQLFNDDKEYANGMNSIALGQHIWGLTIVAFTLMVNHCHILVCGSGEDLVSFFSFMKCRINDRLRKDGYPSLPEGYGFHLGKVADERQMADTIIYIARNPLKACPDVAAGGYPWGSTHLIFNKIGNLTDNKKLGLLSGRQQSRLLESKHHLPDNYTFNEKLGYVLPESFVFTKKAEQVLKTSWRFTSGLIKNVDSNLKISEGIGEMIVWSEEEVNEIIYQKAKELFNAGSVKDLGADDRCRIAVILKRKYRVDTKRIARKLKLDIALLNELFD